MNDNLIRCDWPGDNSLMIKYHDEEWGRPLHDDKLLFEFIVLDTFQAGLSWYIVLKKREHFRKAFDYFDPEKIAKYDNDKLDELLNNKNIIRNRMKIKATINNAKSFLKIVDKYGSFDKFIWQFTDYKVIQNKWEKHEDIPVKTEISDLMSKELKNNGFKFVGSTICYAFMQATGMVNDHLTKCFRHKQLFEE
jgi:DNA-3-methyladenine glycosylase I